MFKLSQLQQKKKMISEISEILFSGNKWGQSKWQMIDIERVEDTSQEFSTDHDSSKASTYSLLTCYESFMVEGMDLCSIERGKLSQKNRGMKRKTKKLKKK